MTAEERFEHLEQYQSRIYESHLKLQDAVIELTRTVSGYMDSADARMRRMEDRLDEITEAADVRLKRIEENLDGLIRAITAEHSNGKSRL